MNISSPSKPSTTGVVPLAKSAFWTVYYFFYFLLTGQPEWKCESHEPKPLTACCAGGRANEGSKWNSTATTTNNNNNSSAATFRSNGHVHEDYSQPHQRQYHQEYHSTASSSTSVFGRLWTKTKSLGSKTWDWLKRAGRWTLAKAGKVGKALWRAVCWLWEKFKAFFSYFSTIKLLPEAERSKSLPPPQLGPKPFSPDSPSFNKVAFDPDATFQNFKQKLETQLKDQFEESQPEEEEDADERTLREPSVPPPAPPPPPPKSAIRIERTPEPETMRYDSQQQQDRGRERPRTPKGVPEMAREVMAELNERMSRAPSVQRELTQSCHPDMAQWKETDRYDRSGSATPWRASSVGPTMRRLEQVVSRLDGNGDSSDNEAQFVFRPPPTTSKPENGYQMGKSVFNPLEEAERMRESINSKNYYGSRPVTPSSYYNESRKYDGGPDLRQRAKTVEPSNYPGRSFTPSLAYSTAPFTSHTARRSKTPVSFDRGANFAFDRNDIQDGVVNRTAGRWPPASNATGAVVERDNWINDMMGRNDDDLITTMCRRVVEKKTQDNWKWRDDAGRLLDEQNQRQWKGELDTVVRDGPQQGRQWSRTVEVRPNGTTLFQDVSRQYDRDYVVESVIRNY